MQLIGYVGNDIRTMNLRTGKKVMLRVATHDTYKNKSGEEKDITYWHDIVAWDGVGDFAERSFVKGSHILVQGTIVYKTYLDQVGHKRYITEIKALILKNLDR